MKRLLLFLAAASSFAATTTVTQNVVGPDGQPASGQALIRITAACRSGADYVGDRTIAVKFTSGAFSVRLVPNDTCSPSGTSYTVAWLLAGGRTWTETWVVPTSATPVTVDSVVMAPPLAPSYMISWQQMAQNGATAGQAPIWNGAAWAPGNAGGVTMASGLGDFGVERTTPTVLTVGANCSSTTPCNVRFGNTVYSFVRSCTATASAGSGTAYIYVSGNGTLTVGHNLTVSTSEGCLAQPGVTAFPADSAPLFSWTATSGTWDQGGGRDLRAFLSNKSVTAGTGVVTVDTGGRTTINVDTATVPMLGGVPADGQVMQYQAATGTWLPIRVRYTATFTGQTLVSVPGATHQLGTADLTVTCYDAATPPNIVEPDGWTVDPVTFDVAIRFTNPQDGRCVLR